MLLHLAGRRFIPHITVRGGKLARILSFAFPHKRAVAA